MKAIIMYFANQFSLAREVSKKQFPSSYRMLLAVFLVLGLVAEAHAGITVPSGLLPGQQFRVVFSSIAQGQATNSNISFYDNIIQSEANAQGLGTYSGSPVTWDCLGSTATVNAVSRLPMDNVPIFLPSLDFHGQELS